MNLDVSVCVAHPGVEPVVGCAVRTMTESVL